MSDSLRPHGAWPTRLLCPFDPPGKNTGVGCHALLQGIFPTQGSNPQLLCLQYWLGVFFTTEPPGKPRLCWYFGVNGSLVCITRVVWLSLSEATCRDLQEKRSRSPPSAGDGGKALDWPGITLQASSPDGLHQTLARHFGRTVCCCGCPAEARRPGHIWRQG